MLLILINYENIPNIEYALTLVNIATAKELPFAQRQISFFIKII